MKKFSFTGLLICVALFVNAQVVTSLCQNFDSSCASASGFPPGWLSFIQYGSLGWTCNPSGGRYSTPGMSCTGEFSTTYTIDTALLITPLLDLSGYTGDVYLMFDTKSTFVSGERLMLLESADTAFDSVLSPVTNLALNPIIGPNDSEGWVTHQVDLTPFKSSPFYVAFMYTSTNTYGTIWYLDNVCTSLWSLKVQDPANQKIPLTVIGNATTSEIRISYNIVADGTYDLIVYDMIGRAVHKESLIGEAGQETYVLNNLDLHPGMYFIKMSNANYYGTAKAIVE